MKELLLGRLAPADELDVVDHQHVNRAKLVLEGDRVLGPERAHELVHEFFGRQIDDPALGIAGANFPSNGMHQVGLAKAHGPIKEQRIEWHAAGFGDAPGGGVGQLVRLADHEVLEGEPSVQGSAQVPIGVIGLAARDGGRGDRLAGRPGFRRPGRTLRFRCWARRRLNDDLDALDSNALVLPQNLDALGVVAHHPIAHKARGHGHARHAVLGPDHSQRFQPTPESRIANLRAQTPPHPRPLLATAQAIPPIAEHVHVPHFAAAPRSQRTPAGHAANRNALLL